MADQLRDAPMWRDRVINFVRDAISASPQLKPISGQEQKILERAKDFRAIDKELPGGLYQLLVSSKNYITPFAALKILLYWYEKNDLNVGYEILFFSARDARAMSDEEIKQLIEILNANPGINIAWTITIIANPDVAVEEESMESRLIPKTTLKLPTDFK